jgi:hypothetical protein
VIVPNVSLAESMCILPNSLTAVFICSCVTLDASKSRNLLNASAVDYFICSPNIIKCIDDLTVLDFSNCFSDVHTPLSITFESNVFEDSDSDINALDNTEHIVKIKKWENEKLHEFRGNFNRQAISDLRNKLLVHS